MIRRILLHVSCLVACAGLMAQAPQTAPPELSQEGRTKVYASCFEVVVPKPEKDPLSYEKELAWSQVPFNIRNDKYHSIGTAFAVGPKELLTAFHVLDLHRASKTYTRFFIRDREQRVYEIDQILAADQARDVVRFTVKEKTFSTWLPLAPTYTLNQTVYTAGNAYGEGMVLRKGDIIGTIPEAESGRWNLLRSSADVNSGNSGGPMVDTSGRVIGIVLARKDNISISLPTAEIQAMKAQAAVFHQKTSYSFSLVPEKVEGVENNYEVALPKTYAALQQEAVALARGIYDKRMGELFAQAKDQYFPRGEASEEAILDIPNSGGVEFLFKDTNTKKWAFSDLKYTAYEAGGEAKVHMGGASGLGVGIIRPDKPADLQRLLENPKELMELFFKGVNYPREVGGQPSRIISLGNPVMEQDMKDALGRPWQLKVWALPHLDQYVAMYLAPVPRGVAFVLKQMSTASFEEWLYDMKPILDLIYLPYVGSVKEWNAFLALPKGLPAGIRDIQVRLEPNRQLKVDTPWISFQVGKDDMELDPEMVVGLYMGYAWKGSEVVWDLRKAAVSEAEDNTFFSLLRHLKPTPKMTEAYQKGWRELLKRKHPYTGSAFSEEGGTRIATVLDLGRAPSQSVEDASSLYTLYYVKSGTVAERQMKAGLKRLAEGHKLPAVPTAVGVH